MDMLLVCDILLVEMIHVDFLLAVGGTQELEEVSLELVGEVVDVFAGVFADEEHLTDVGFGLGVAFEAILIARLLLADLAVPAESLEAFGFQLVVEVLCGAYLGFRHNGGTWGFETGRGCGCKWSNGGVDS